MTDKEAKLAQKRKVTEAEVDNSSVKKRISNTTKRKQKLLTRARTREVLNILSRTISRVSFQKAGLREVSSSSGTDSGELQPVITNVFGDERDAASHASGAGRCQSLGRAHRPAFLAEPF